MASLKEVYHWEEWALRFLEAHPRLRPSAPLPLEQNAAISAPAPASACMPPYSTMMKVD